MGYDGSAEKGKGSHCTCTATLGRHLAYPHPVRHVLGIGVEAVMPEAQKS